MRRYHCDIDGCPDKVSAQLQDSKGFMHFCTKHGRAAERLIQAIRGSRFGLVLTWRVGHAFKFA
jgi:hypothetical protein